MNKKQIWCAIIGSGVIASITTAVSYFPQQAVILTPLAALVTALVAYVTGKSA